MQKLNVAFGAVFSFLSIISGLFGPDTPTISAEELLINKHKYVVLDVRSAEEFQTGHIEGAINIPHSDIEDEIAKLKAIDKTIVVHCRSGYRAGKAEAKMAKLGLTNFVHLEGDMLGWQEQNLPLVKGDSKP